MDKLQISLSILTLITYHLVTAIDEDRNAPLSSLTHSHSHTADTGVETGAAKRVLMTGTASSPRESSAWLAPRMPSALQELDIECQVI
ncbi:hypothetical protein HK097_008021 [Rhizophlyctis rosea]|uniref:Secreted protein n=1 Tax=Rhizophlyctis rosea TaxID=64517 RepID=A0AAD5SAW1_9FUNG|nr:hypothetical protein HK097_008021 [Rhizophlyctis rosea]